MIILEKALVEKIIGYHKLSDYLAVVVDYKGEEKLIDLRNEIEVELLRKSNDGAEFSVGQVIDCFGADDEAEDRYLYNQNEVIEELFPDFSKKNRIIQSAFHWIPFNEKLDWILLNVLCENKHYDKVEKINVDYLMTTEKLRDLY